MRPRPLTVSLPEDLVLVETSVPSTYMQEPATIAFRMSGATLRLARSEYSILQLERPESSKSVTTCSPFLV